MKKIIILLIFVFGFSIGVYANEAYDILKKGNQYFSNKDFDNALEQYQKAVGVFPNYAKAHFNIGLVYREKGNFKKAKVAFVKAKQLYALQNNQDKTKETEKMHRSIELAIGNQRRSGYLLLIFIPLIIFGLYKMYKKRVRFSDADDVIFFLLFGLALAVSRFSPIFQRQSLLWWCRVGIIVAGYTGGLFFLARGVYTHCKLTKKSKSSKTS